MSTCELCFIEGFERTEFSQNSNRKIDGNQKNDRS